LKDRGHILAWSCPWRVEVDHLQSGGRDRRGVLVPFILGSDLPKSRHGDVGLDRDTGDVLDFEKPRRV